MTDRSTLRIRYKKFRKKALSFTPFVKRRRHEKIVARLNKELDRVSEDKETLGYLFLERPLPAAAARADVRVPIVAESVDELCLFLTYAPHVDIKPHVIDHVEALLDAGIRVVLIANTDLDFSSLRIPPDLLARLHGCIVRQNVGYDFGAWAHAYSLIEPTSIRRRLYLINDSIIGPLDGVAYQALLQRIRESTADFVGLTSNPDPQEHLQSFYLTINERLLRHAVFDEFMRGVVNMPRKQHVVDCYEIWLTTFLKRKGFTSAALFPNGSNAPRRQRDDTLWRWKQLMSLGFPFVKATLLSHAGAGDEVRQLIPARYLVSK